MLIFLVWLTKNAEQRLVRQCIISWTKRLEVSEWLIKSVLIHVPIFFVYSFYQWPGLTGTVCNKNEFPFNSSKCKKFYAEPGTVPKGKLSDHPVTKYLATFFAFLFWFWFASWFSWSFNFSFFLIISFVAFKTYKNVNV